MKQILLISIFVLICHFPLLVFADNEGIAVSNLQTRVIYKSSSHSTYSMKADVENAGASGDVTVRLIAKSKDGFELNNTILAGHFESGEKKTLTGTTLARPEIADQIETWEIGNINRYPK